MSAEISRLNPPDLGKPLGLYSHITQVRAATEHYLIAGQLAVNQAGAVVGKSDFEAQLRQVFANIRTALHSVDCSFANVTKFTTYIVRSAHLEEFMAARKRLFGEIFPDGRYPPNTLLVIDRLVEKDCLVEVETAAAR